MSENHLDDFILPDYTLSKLDEITIGLVFLLIFPISILLVIFDPYHYHKIPQTSPTPPKQTIIASKVITMAKTIQSAEANNQHLVIVQRRQSGKTAAIRLAKGEQILPTNLSDSNSAPSSP